MSRQPAPLQNVLAHKQRVVLKLDNITAQDLKKIARFWFGTTASNKMRKDECLAALEGVWHDRARLEQVLPSLTDKERQVLALFRRYGGSLSGPLLMAEGLTRGLCAKTIESRSFYTRPRTEDPIQDLGMKLLLVMRQGSPYSPASYYHFSYRHSYPDLVMAPLCNDLIEPAGPLAWQSPAAIPQPETTLQRSAAQVALDLCGIAQALAREGCWDTTRAGAPAKSVQKRLRKLLPDAKHDPLTPPAPESLYYEILRGLGAIKTDASGGSIDLAVLERHLRQPAVVQCWHVVRAWIHARLWQDDTGVVSERDNRSAAGRQEPEPLLQAREVLVWGLSRVAHGSNAWLDVKTFHADLKSALGDSTICWYWFNREAGWATHALLGTLFSLGLVERGQEGGADAPTCCRLTEVGQAVFGAPEVAWVPPPQEPHFLTVQPNYEVTAYLDAAPAEEVWPLAQMARRVSATTERVQTFALSRESVYQALEGGLALDEMRRFLSEHSKTGLPANVAHCLDEWGRKREALVIRTDVSLAVAPPGAAAALEGFSQARSVGDTFLLLPKSASPGKKKLFVVDHTDFTKPSWRVDEQGKVSVPAQADALALARLRQFADPAEQDWQITSASVRRAASRGFSAEEVLAWLSMYVGDELPAILATAIDNWSRPTSVFLGNLLMLQVPDPQACAAVLSSPRFSLFLLGHVPPNWFIVSPENRAGLEQLLTELGFSISRSYERTQIADGSPAGSGRRRKKSHQGKLSDD